ncbi:MAG TPA: ScyD/ScyE family protein [Nocardioides sp.]|nr:ScyD/ScyE family protein [Nocardioides sp.]
MFKEVATGLDNPRQIDFGPDGAMYVAEAGHGSFHSGSSGPCIVGGEGTACLGATGSVTRVRHGEQHRVLTGLASLGGKTDGSFAFGPSDLVVVGKHTIVLSIGLGTDPADRRRLHRLGRRQLAHVLAFDLRSGKRTVVGDLGAREAQVNPVGRPDSDPTGVAKAGKVGYLVTDSGANTLVRAKSATCTGSPPSGTG